MCEAQEPIQRTLIIIKPDATQRKLTGKILEVYKNNGLKVITQTGLRMSKAQAAQLYAAHKGKDFFGGLTDYMASGPTVAVVLEGEMAIQKVRKLNGATDPNDAAPDTIRGMFGPKNEEYIGPNNSVHASDSEEAAAKEIEFFFQGKNLAFPVRVAA